MKVRIEQAIIALVILVGVILMAYSQSASAATIATWYGPGFYGNNMACGGTYDPNAMTAAHPSMPCGTRALVSDGNDQVEVTITDRCACGIDLSEGAARALGTMDNPTPVSVEPTGATDSEPVQPDDAPQRTELPATGGVDPKEVGF